MRLVSFVCLRAWTGPNGKGAGFGSTKGGGCPPPPLEGGGGPPPLQPPKLSNTPRGHTLAGGGPRGYCVHMHFTLYWKANSRLGLCGMYHALHHLYDHMLFFATAVAMLQRTFYQTGAPSFSPNAIPSSNTAQNLLMAAIV